ncbi:MAG: hypothetical protein WD250_13155 [Egibacteraceae bacterium]
MSPPNEKRRPGEGGGAEISTGRRTNNLTPECTPRLSPGPPCRPGCALVCSVASWSHVLDDRNPAPPHWRLCWAIVGLPVPLRPGEWPDLLDAFEAAYGTGELVVGLRMTAATPPLSAGCGAPWLAADRARAGALLAAAERRLAVAA